MELSDYTRNASNVDSTSGTDSRMQHTHHITIQGGTVTQIATGGFALTGPVSITKDGSPAPLTASTLSVTISRRKHRRVLKHHVAIPGWCTGSFRAAVDPRRGEPQSRLSGGCSSGSLRRYERQLRRHALGRRYDLGLGSRILAIGREYARLSGIRKPECCAQRNGPPLLLGSRRRIRSMLHSVDCSLPGSWTLTVHNACSPTPSNSLSVTIN